MLSGEAGGAPRSEGALVIVGRVRKPQGLHGELLVETVTDEPDAVFAAGRRVLLGTAEGDADSGAPALTVKRARPFKTGYIVGFAGIEDRTAAEQWRGRYLLVPVEELPGLSEGEVYRHDLLGMEVRDDEAGEIGTVAEVYDFPHGLMLEVVDGKRSVLVPYRPEMVRTVDREARLISVTLPPGMLE